MRTNDTRPQPFSRSWRIRAFLREWRAALIVVPCIGVLLLGIFLKQGVIDEDHAALQKGVAKVVFVRPTPGDSQSDPSLVGLKLDGVTVLANTRTHVTPGEQVRVTYRYLARSFRYEVEQVEPATGG